MSLPNGSASGIERMLACPASVVLPRVHRESEFADKGHQIHNYTRAVLTGTPPEEAIVSVDKEHQETCRRIDWRKLGGDLRDVRSEVAYAIDVRARTARELGVNIGRNYAAYNLGPHEIPGSLDIEGTRFDGVDAIIDLKSGWADVTSPDSNGQLLFFAAAKHLLTGASEVETRIAKLHMDGSIRPVGHTHDAFEIESFLDELDEGLARVESTRRVYLAGGAPDVFVGDHCRYCESKPHCFAFTRLALGVAGEADELAKTIALLTPAQRGVAWTKAKMVESLLESVLEALKSFAKDDPFPVGEGKVVRAVPSGSSSFNVGAALALLRSYGASEETISGLYRQTRFDTVRETNAPGVRRTRRSQKEKAA